MRVSALQFAPVRHKPEENRDALLKRLEHIESDLVVLPELCISGYTFDTRDQLIACSEPADGPTADLMQEWSDTSGTALVYGFAESDESSGLIYNSALCIRPGEAPVLYRKAHLFDREKEFFSPGDTPFTVFTLGDVKIGMLICFDHIFPEAARALALQGAQIICHPSDLVLPGTAQLTTRVRSIENRVFWIMANRVGSEGDLTFTGLSQITAPGGMILEHAPSTGEMLLTVEIEPSLADDKNITRANNLLSDRRTDLYGNLI